MGLCRTRGCAQEITGVADILLGLTPAESVRQNVDWRVFRVLVYVSRSVSTLCPAAVTFGCGQPATTCAGVGE